MCSTAVCRQTNTAALTCTSHAYRFQDRQLGNTKARYTATPGQENGARPATQWTDLVHASYTCRVNHTPYPRLPTHRNKQRHSSTSTTASIRNENEPMHLLFDRDAHMGHMHDEEHLLQDPDLYKPSYKNTSLVP